MLTFTVIVAIVVSAAAIAYVVLPLVQSGSAPLVVENDRLTDLIARKDATLAAIKDLEFDYRTGKLSQEDYERMDQRLRRQAIGYIQQIEKLAPQSTMMDDKIEAEIASRRKTAGVAPVPAATQPAPRAPVSPQAPADESAVAQPLSSDSGAPDAVRFCTNCGNPVKPTHRFCANCGAPVPEETTANGG